MPYKVLGLPENASLIDVKARYLTLAKEHHPDRLMGDNVTDADRERHEEIFKKISCAYDDIVNGRTGTRSFGFGCGFGEGEGGEGGGGFAADWMKIWEQFINDDNIQRIKDIVRDAMEMRRKAVEEAAAEAEAPTLGVAPHTAHVTLTLEEVFKRKRKKIRVWVPVDGRSAKAAVSVVIECGPDIGGAKVFYRACPDGRDLMVTITIAEHPVFILDRMINNIDLYHKREITLADYISGGRWEIPYLDGSVFAYELLPFQDITLPIVFEGRGINSEGSLIVMWTLSLPKNLGSLSLREIEILKIWGRGQTQTHLENGGGDVN